MPYHIKRTCAIDSNLTVYYEGGVDWSDDYSKRKTYSSDPTSLLSNTDGKNGGFTGASVVSE